MAWPQWGLMQPCLLFFLRGLSIIRAGMATGVALSLWAAANDYGDSHNGCNNDAPSLSSFLSPPSLWTKTINNDLLVMSASKLVDGLTLNNALAVAVAATTAEPVGGARTATGAASTLRVAANDNDDSHNNCNDGALSPSSLSTSSRHPHGQ